MMSSKFHEKYIDHMMVGNKTQIKAIVESLFQNEDVFLMRNFDKNQHILLKQMNIEY